MAMVKTINALEAYKKIRNSGGRIFVATFVKKDGSTRAIVAKRGVQKNLTGKGLRYSPESKLLVNVFDMKKNDYRMINLKTLITLWMGRNVYHVTGFNPQ